MMESKCRSIVGSKRGTKVERNCGAIASCTISQVPVIRRSGIPVLYPWRIKTGVEGYLDKSSRKSLQLHGGNLIYASILC